MTIISVHIVGNNYKVFEETSLVKAIDEAVYWLQTLRETNLPLPEDYDDKIPEIKPENDLPG